MYCLAILPAFFMWVIKIEFYFTSLLGFQLIMVTDNKEDEIIIQDYENQLFELTEGYWQSNGLDGTFFQGPVPKNTQTRNSRGSHSRMETLILRKDGTFEYSCVDSHSLCGTASFEVQESRYEDAGAGTWCLEHDTVVLSGKFYLDMEYWYETTSDKVRTDDQKIALTQFGEGGVWTKVSSH